METATVASPTFASDSTVESASSPSPAPAAAPRKRTKPIHWQPKYRHHKPSGQAVATIDGQDHYLGVYDTKESKETYNRLIAEWRENGCRLPTARATDQITVKEIVIAFWRYAKGLSQGA